MTIRILPAVGDPDAVRPIATLLSRLPDAEPAPPVTDSTALLDTLAGLGHDSIDNLPEVVLVHERIGPVPALELIREVALRFPAVGVVLATSDAGPALFSAAMDAGARGLAGLPLSYDELAVRVQTAAQWAAGVRRHLGVRTDALPGPAGTLVTVTGAKGGVGTTVTAVHLALAARAAGREVALVDLDLQSGDIASYLDVQFRRSIADLAGIDDIAPRVLQDAVFPHPTGLGLLLAPEEGERGEEVGDRAARQVIGALRARSELVVVDCGSQMNDANAAVIEMADIALLVTTPDVVAVRSAKRIVRLWDRLQVRKAEATTTVVNRLTRRTEIQPALIERATGTKVARTSVPAGYKELQPAVDSGRMQDLDSRSAVKQALWGLAGELGLVEPPGPRRPQAPVAAPAPGPAHGAHRLAKPPRPIGLIRRRAIGGDGGQVSVELLGLTPLILLVLVLLWQFALVGYTYTLAGNSADKGARAAAAADSGGPGSCRSAALEDLPSAWAGSARIDCGTGGGLWQATVRVKVPVLFPGAVDFPWTVTGRAGAVEEDNA